MNQLGRGHHGAAALVMLAGAALVFLVLALGAMVWPRLPGDRELALAVQGAVPEPVLPVLQGVALLGEALVALPLTLLVAALLGITGRKWPALLVLLTLIPDGASYLIKDVIGRPRPDPALLLVGQADATGFSFPSGHAVHFVVFFGLLAVALPSWWPMPLAVQRVLVGGCLALIVLAGLGRIALGAHWPSDVLGGYALGFLYLQGLRVFYFRFSATIPRLQPDQDTSGPPNTLRS